MHDSEQSRDREGAVELRLQLLQEFNRACGVRSLAATALPVRIRKFVFGPACRILERMPGHVGDIG